MTETLKSLHIIPPTGMPPVECILVEEPQPEGPYGAKGIGEAALVPTAAAVAGALYELRRDPPDVAADEGLAGGARGRPAPATADSGSSHDPRGRARSSRRSIRFASSTATSAVDDGPHRASRRAAGGSTRHGRLIVPGIICAHTHLYSALARGMPYPLEPPTSFVEILQRIWWRLDRALDVESIRASALVGGMEALLSGTTTLIDHHASPNAIDGSLDVIEEALGVARRRARSSATRRATATG